LILLYQKNTFFAIGLLFFWHFDEKLPTKAEYDLTGYGGCDTIERMIGIYRGAQGGFTPLTPTKEPF
jgi:hypothetical protein